MFGIGEKENINNQMKARVVSDMSDFLMGYGFTPTDAEKASKKFWNENIKSVTKKWKDDASFIEKMSKVYDR